MKKIIFIIFCFLLSGFTNALTLSEQREIYTQIITLQEQGKWKQASQKSPLINQYPLKYLLDYQQLKNNFSKDSLTAIQTFTENNKQYKITDDLQRSYLYYLAKNKYWSTFLSFYPQLPNSTNLKCYHFQAKIAQNEASNIWPEVKKTWLNGKSLDNTCDRVFQYYLANKKISQLLIWQRFKLAYIKNQTSLMSYLITLMRAANKKQAEQLYQLKRNPKKLLTSKLFSLRKKSNYSLLVTSIKSLSKIDINLGLQAYSTYDKKIGFSSIEKMELKKYFITRILIKNKTKLLPWSDKELLILKDKKLLERRVRYAIKNNNWPNIAYWLKQLSSSQKQKNKWQYWQARVLEHQQQNKKANILYKKVASERTYYGFLAAQKLGLDYQFNAKMVKKKDQSLDLFNSQLIHIEELYFHEQMSLLKREWAALLEDESPDLQRQLGLYAKKKGWLHLSVIASIHSASWDALNIRFPDVKSDYFLSNANKYQLEPAYIYALTRQESSFDEFARSPVGARGYMQLMPQTAFETAQKIGLTKYKKPNQLTEGKINIQLGSAYFNMLLKRYLGNRVLATAAYNAGPRRVGFWQTEKKEKAEKGLTMDSWVETIPYKETRRYVKNVLAYNVIYQYLLNKPQIFLTTKEINALF